jgi:hypothetical protein
MPGGFLMAAALHILTPELVVTLGLLVMGLLALGLALILSGRENKLSRLLQITLLILSVVSFAYLLFFLALLIAD